MKSQIILSLMLIIGFIFPQIDVESKQIPIGIGARYITDTDGVIRMYVNIWGHVSNPGRILVDEGIDLSTLLSLSGGPVKGANLKKVRVYHEYPGEDGKTFHTIDLTEFIKTGSRSNFIEIQPNDTFIIKQTAWSYFIEEVGSINTFMSLINLFLNIKEL